MQCNGQQFVSTNSRSVYSSTHKTFQYSIVSRAVYIHRICNQNEQIGQQLSQAYLFKCKIDEATGKGDATGRFNEVYITMCSQQQTRFRVHPEFPCTQTRATSGSR